MSDAAARRESIIQLVGENRIRTQTDLLNRLKALGFEATQATISRDIGAVGLGKVFGYYSLSGQSRPVLDLESRIREKVIRVRKAGPYMVVVLTHTGEASSVGLAIDEEGWPSVVGCLAGDDTVLVACDNAADTSDVIHRFKAISSTVAD